MKTEDKVAQKPFFAVIVGRRSSTAGGLETTSTVLETGPGPLRGTPSNEISCGMLLLNLRRTRWDPPLYHDFLQEIGPAG